MYEFNELLKESFSMEGVQNGIIKKILKDMPQEAHGYLENQFYNKVKNGICYMLSMEWLRLIISNSDLNWKEFGENIIDTKPVYYKQIMTNFYTYATRDDVAVLTKTLLYNDIRMDKVLVNLCMNKIAGVTNEKIVDTESDFANRIIGGNNKYFFVRLEMKRAAHQIALYKETDNKLYIYDPNIGIISISSTDKSLMENTTEVIRKIWRMYAGFGANYRIEKAYIRIIEKVNP